MVRSHKSVESIGETVKRAWGAYPQIPSLSMTYRTSLATGVKMRNGDGWRQKAYPVRSTCTISWDLKTRFHQGEELGTRSRQGDELKPPTMSHSFPVVSIWAGCFSFPTLTVHLHPWRTGPLFETSCKQKGMSCARRHIRQTGDKQPQTSSTLSRPFEQDRPRHVHHHCTFALFGTGSASIYQQVRVPLRLLDYPRLRLPRPMAGYRRLLPAYAAG